MKIVIILGSPGSGKGTQAERLKAQFKLEYIGSGELLRARGKFNDFTGKKIRRYIDNGKRLPTPVIFQIWMEKLQALKKKKNLKGIIFDGSPRTTFEAEMLEWALDWYDWLKHRKVIFVKLSEQEAIDRLLKRRQCIKCLRIIPYSDEFKARRKCDRCGGRLVRRTDDSKTGIKERLRWFKAKVLPTVDYYRKKKGFYEINGAQSVQSVYQDILRIMR